MAKKMPCVKCGKKIPPFTVCECFIPRPQARTVLQLRRALCLEIAEDLERTFSLSRTEWDVDEAARVIESQLPSTRDESIAEAEELRQIPDTTAPLPGPSLPAQLRDALGFHEGCELRQALELAVKRCRAFGPLLKACEELVAGMLSTAALGFSEAEVERIERARAAIAAAKEET